MEYWSDGLYLVDYVVEFMRRSMQETFGKHSILFKVKEGEDFSRRNTLSILRTEI